MIQPVYDTRNQPQEGSVTTIAGATGAARRAPVPFPGRAPNALGNHRHLAAVNWSSPVVKLAKGALWLLAMVLMTPSAGAQTIDPDAVEDAGDGVEIVPKRKLDVVQNKSFTKEGRVELYVNAFGLVTNNQFARRQIILTGGSFAYHVREQVYVDLALQYFPYGESNIKPLTDALLFLNSGDDAEPVTVPAERFYAAVSLGVSPIYGKINLVAEHVQNFDVSFLVGLGRLWVSEHSYRGSYDNEGNFTRNELEESPAQVSYNAGHLGIATRFPMASWLTLKGEARFVGYIQEVPDYQALPDRDDEGNTVYPTKRAFANAFIVSTGASFFF